MIIFNVNTKQTEWPSRTYHLNLYSKITAPRCNQNTISFISKMLYTFFLYSFLDIKPMTRRSGAHFHFKMSKRGIKESPYSKSVEVPVPTYIMRFKNKPLNASAWLCTEMLFVMKKCPRLWISKFTVVPIRWHTLQPLKSIVRTSS